MSCSQNRTRRKIGFGPSGPGCPLRTASSLNTLLIPTFLQNLTNTQICNFLNSGSKNPNLFLSQVNQFTLQLRLAKRYTAQRKCFCPYRIPWSTSTNPLIIPQKSLTDYFNFLPGSNTGFAYIWRQSLQTILNNRRRRNAIQEGKSVC